MPAVFTNVTVFPKILGNTSLSWELNPYFNEKLNYVFSVYSSHSGVPLIDFNTSPLDWVLVGTTTNNYNFVDPNQRVWSYSDRWFYCVSVTTGDGNTYYSDPAVPYGNLNQHDRVIANEIIRKEYLLLSQYTGSCGTLVKRRTWGELCPNNCLDFDTKDVINQSCGSCFGCGYLGGYFPGIPYTINTNPVMQDRITRNETVNMSNVQIAPGRALACPIPKTNDFWVDTATDERWMIQNVAHIAKLKSMPIVLQLELRLIAPTDIIYTFQV